MSQIDLLLSDEPNSQKFAAPTCIREKEEVVKSNSNDDGDDDL